VVSKKRNLKRKLEKQKRNLRKLNLERELLKNLKEGIDK